MFVLLGLPVGESRVATALAASPARWVGVRSYSWYLWHWPAMVFIAAVLDRPIGGWSAVAVGVATLGLASLTFRAVEQLVRRSPRLVGSPRLSVGLGVAVTVALAALFLALMSVPGEVVGPGERAEDIARRALDARALDEAALVEDVPSNLVPGLAGADQHLPAVYDDGCHRSILQDTPVVCGYGDVSAERRVVLIGDSHAAQWVPALDALGRQAPFNLIPLTKAGCPAAAVTVHDGSLRRRFTECERWRDATVELVRQLQPDLLCGTRRCPVIVGDVLVYRDDSHLTATYARRLAPRLAAVLEAAVPEDNPVVAADG